MSSEGCRCGLRDECTLEGGSRQQDLHMLAELGKCTRHDIGLVRNSNGRWSKTATSLID